MAIRKITDKTAVAVFISRGVAAGAGGFMIVGGKIVPIPPRGPLLRQLFVLLNKIAIAKAVK